MAYKFQIGDAVLSGSLTAKQGSLYASGSLVELALRDDANKKRWEADYNGGNIRMRLKNSAGVTKAYMAEGSTSLSGSGDVLALGKIVVGGQQYGINANGEITGSAATLSGLTNQRVTFAGVGGRLSDNAGLTYNAGSTTLVATKIGAFEAAGAIDFSDEAMTNVNIDSGAIDGTAIGAASQSTIKATTISGSSTLHVGGISTLQATNAQALTATTISGSSTLQAGGNMTTAGTVKFLGVADTALAVASDSFYFKDGDGLVKSDTMADYATAIAGDGLSAAAGVLAVSLSELTEAAVNVGGDSLIFIDADGTVTRKDTFADYATAAAGAGLGATGGIFAVNVSGAVHVVSDKVSISGSIAGDGLSYAGGVDSILSMALDLNELTAKGGSLTPAADSLAFVDAGASNASKKISMTNFANSIKAASNSGLVAASGQLTVSVNDLGAGAVAVASDSIAFLDADDNLSKKESIVDLVSAMAGAGITATAGVLSVQSNAVAQASSGTPLAEGYNYTTGSAGGSFLLPAAPTVGDVVTLKINADDGGKVSLAKQGSHTIDGTLNSVTLDSAHAAVTMVYVVANAWKIV